MIRTVLSSPGAPLRILCLGAHCDDLEIGCGGAVLRLLGERPGSSVHWVTLSSNSEREAEARASAAEFLEAAASRDVVINAFRDGYFPFQGAEIKDFFEATKAAFQPELVLTHHRGDRHQDHRLVAELTWNTFRNHLIFEYEIPKYEGDLGQPNVYVSLASAIAERKVALILKHYRSQAGRSWFRAETFEALMRLRGIECNAEAGFAEAFHVPKITL